MNTSRTHEAVRRRHWHAAPASSTQQQGDESQRPTQHHAASSAWHEQQQHGRCWAHERERRASIWCRLLLSLALSLGCLCQTVHAGESKSIPIFSFDRGPINCKPGAPNFTYVVASDAQLWWWTRDDNSSVKTMGQATNQAQWELWQSAGNLTWPDGSAITAPRAVVMNGDLTTFGLQSELNQYRSLYTSPNNTLPVFPGLGNHDYWNNQYGCFDWGVDVTTCARNAITVIRQTISGVEIDSNVFKFFARLQGPLGGGSISSRINAFDWGSGAYSWDEGNYHFIMLHFHPAFTIDMNSINVAGPVVVTPSYSFLEKELAKTKATGRKAVLFIHDVDEHWVAADDDRFMSIIDDTPVVAVFCGHWHWLWGLVTTLNTTSGHKVPVLRSGSSEYQTSFIVQFGEQQMQMQLVTSEPGGPAMPYNATDYIVNGEYYKYDVSSLACSIPEDTPTPATDCPPDWERTDDACLAPCPEKWSLKSGRCVRKDCGSIMERNGLLCYPPCAKGYAGSGPVCWADCPEGTGPLAFLCASATCPEGMTKEGGMCYADCDEGYKPVGAVCWENCPDGWSDDGPFCKRQGKAKARKSTNRRSRAAVQFKWRGMSFRGLGLPLGGSIDRDWYALR